ncbi:MAG: prepilin-type N-terminal cleavage/methylation domain-containing protein [Candidatus Dojkabacteria bacterium]|nr:prepilin-type N-terminal cleavage/methylation domain-containing protein [Candidatus Dojkabacteria bacterium]MDQ7020458.1 prepilin-type N-terminal cleavage/methylation domain-containing protein [Candidatus Dojkabacteria bacterium]
MEIVDKKHGFTLIEVLVSLGITVMIFLTAIFSFRYYQSSVELQTVTLDFVTYTNSLQNEARNAVINPALDFTGTGRVIDQLPDYYVLEIIDNDFNKFYCKDSLVGIGCTDSIDISRNNNYIDVGIESDCQYIAVRRRNLDMIQFDTNLNPIDSGTCTVVLTHSLRSRTNIIEFALEKNTINESSK